MMIVAIKNFPIIALLSLSLRFFLSLSPSPLALSSFLYSHSSHKLQSVVLIMILTTNAQVRGDGLDINISLLHTAVPKGAVHPHMPMLRELGVAPEIGWSTWRMDKGMIISLARCLSLVMIIVLTGNAQVRGEAVNLTTRSLLYSAVPKGAVCLDGSPPSYAYIEGSGSGSRNWIVFMEGGGWCALVEQCLQRSTEYLGSSFIPKEGYMSGIFDSDPRFNPDFYNWNKAFIHYCDGSVFMSDIQQVDPISNLTFRGARIYKVMMEEMVKKGMGNAENAILTGSSAGGLATILHCDRFRALFPNTTRVKCISDSGFFIRGKDRFANLSAHHFAEVIATHKLAGSLPTSCTSKRDPNLCLFPEYLVSDIKTPLFIVESAFDSFQIDYNLKNAFGGMTVWKNCTSNVMLCSSTQLGILKDFHTNFIDELVKLDSSSSRGMFIDSCYMHTHIMESPGWTCSSVVGNNVLANKTIGKAVSDWFFDRSSFREINSHDTPQNCTNLFSKQLLEEKCLASLSHSDGPARSYLLGLIIFVCVCILN